jgi:hypothetical protein
LNSISWPGRLRSRTSIHHCNCFSIGRCLVGIAVHTLPTAQGRPYDLILRFFIISFLAAKISAYVSSRSVFHYLRPPRQFGMRPNLGQHRTTVATGLLNVTFQVFSASRTMMGTRMRAKCLLGIRTLSGVKRISLHSHANNDLIGLLTCLDMWGCKSLIKQEMTT